MDFIDVIKGRHSPVNFEKDFEITPRDYDNLFKLTKQAPSPFNLQTTKYIVVKNNEVKDTIYELSYRQYKIHTASAIIIVLGDKSAISIKTAEEVYLPAKSLGMINADDYKTLMGQIEAYADSMHTNPLELEKELIKVASINVAFLTMSAKYLGFDTCIMHIQQEDSIRELLKIPDNTLPVLMIAIGKSVDKRRPRGYRKAFDDTVSYDKAGYRW